MKKIFLSLLLILAQIFQLVPTAFANQSADLSPVYLMLSDAICNQDEFVKAIDDAVDGDALDKYAEGIFIEAEVPIGLLGENLEDTVGADTEVFVKDGELHLSLSAYSDVLDYELGKNEETGETYINCDDTVTCVETSAGEADDDQIQGMLIDGTTFARVSDIADATGYTPIPTDSENSVKLLKKFQTKRIFAKLKNKNTITDDILVEAFAGAVDIAMNPDGLIFAEFGTEEATKASYELLSVSHLVEYTELDNLFPVSLDTASYTWGTENGNFTGYIQDNKLLLNTDKEVTVAVIDTGLNAQDTIFSGRVVYDETMTMNSDPDGHGTHVAGIVAATTQLVGDNVNICPYRVEVIYDESGNSMLNSADIYSAISKAVTHDVINMSISMNELSSRPVVKEAINSGKNTVFVVSAGNENVNVQPDTLAEFVAALSNGIVVTAVDKYGNPASFSNRASTNNSSFIAAPGVAISSTYYINGIPYISMDGTSMSSPHVAGACAVLALLDDNNTPDKIKNSLFTHHVYTPSNWNTAYGKGILRLNHSDSGTFGEGFEWKYSGGYLTITGSRALPCFETEEQIPWKNYCSRITGIMFSGDISGITADFMAYHPSLESINISADNTHYTNEDGVLYTKNKDTLVMCLPGSNMSECVVADTTTTISNNAFINCVNLSSVVIPPSVTSIGSGAFEGCTYLADIYCKGTEAQWNSVQKSQGWDDNTGTQTYKKTYNLSFDYISPDYSGKCGDTAIWKVWTQTGVLEISGKGATYDFDTSSDENGGITNTAGWKPYKDAIKTVEIKDGITVIGKNAFALNTSCTEITMGNTVTTIREGAFDYLLKKLTLSPCFEKFDGPSVSGCMSLTGLSVHPDNPRFKSTDNVLYSSDGTVLVAYPCGLLNGDFTVPDGVVKIENDAFNGNYYIENIKFNEGLVTIGDRAFMNSNLNYELVFPSTLKTIGERAFEECSSIRYTGLPHGFENVGNRAFYGCLGLRYMSLPTTLKSIGRWAFTGCNYMKELCYAGTSAQWDAVNKADDWNFSMTAKLVFDRTLPGRATDDEGMCGSNASWEYWAQEGVLKINGYGAMDDNDVLYENYRKTVKTLYIANGITEIGNGFFEYFINLETVVLPNTITKIGNRAFTFCTSLKSISIPGSVEEIGEYAFLGCSSMESVTMLWGVKNIRYQAFAGCDALTAVVMENSVELIEDGVFWDCPLLNNVTIPTGVTKIYNGTFEGCTSLSNIVLHDNITSIGDEAFKDCVALEKLTLPKNLEEITNRTFAGSGVTSFDVHPESTKLTSHDGVLFSYDMTSLIAYPIGKEGSVYAIPSETTEIKSYAFQYAEHLEEVVLHSGIKTIPAYAFNYAPKLKKVNLSNVETIGEFAFYRCYVFEDMGEARKLKTVGRYAFTDNRALKNLTIYENVTFVGESAFSGCTSVSTILIYKGERDFGGRAFEIGEALKNVYHTGTSEEWAGAYNWHGVDIIHGYNPQSHCSGGTFNETITWSLDLNTGVLEFGGTGDIPDFKSQKEVPWCFEDVIKAVVVGEGITSLGSYSFYGCDLIESVTIEGSLSKIGDYCFYCCTELKSVSSSKPIKSIGNYAFDSCSKLSEAPLSEGTEHIGNYAFWDCSAIESLTIPGSIKTFGKYCFYRAYGLTRVNVSSGAVTLGEYMFAQCKSLSSVTLPDTFEAVPANAFNQCSVLTEITMPETLVSIGEKAFYGCAKLSLTKLPSALKTIGASAFYNCNSITSLVVYPSLESIGTDGLYFSSTVPVYFTASPKEWNAITGATALKTISVCHNFDGKTIPDHYGYAGYFAWHIYEDISTLKIFGSGTMSSSMNYYYSAYADKIKYIVLDENITSISMGSFKNLTSLEEYTFPSHITTLNSGIFTGCTALSRIDITGLDITEIPESFFSGLTALTEAPLPDGITVIPDYAFSGCSMLQEIDIPSGVTTIGAWAFSGCSALKSIDLPSGVTGIGERAFYKCTSLATIEIPAGVEAIGSYTFDLCKSLTHITIGENVKTIGENAFSNSGLVSVVISDGVETIGSSAFSSCTKLTQVSLPDSVTSLRNNAFSSCSSLSSITFGSGVKSIESQTFMDCKSLATVNFAKGLETIKTKAFLRCTALDFVEFPDDLKNIEDGSFGGCTALATIVVPTELETIGSFPSGVLKAVYYKGTQEQWRAITGSYVIDKNIIVYSYNPGNEEDAFWSFDKQSGILTITADGNMSEWTCNTSNAVPWKIYADKITSAHIGADVTLIGADAFSGLDNLVSVEIDPGNKSFRSEDGFVYSLTSGELVFYSGENSATSITLPDGITKLACQVFKDNIALTEIILPEGLTTIGEYAFSGCTALTTLYIPGSLAEIKKGAFDSCTALISLQYGGGIKQWENVTKYSTWNTNYKAVYYYVDMNNPSKGYGSDASKYYVWRYYEDQKLLKLFVESDTMPAMDSLPSWSSYMSTIETFEIVGSPVNIGKYTFTRLTNLKKIIIPDSVVKIDEYAFSQCSKFNDTSWLDGITTIGDYAFSSWSGLVEINIPDTVTSIGKSAFSSCYYLEKITIPESVTSIGEYAFDACRKLTSLTFPKSITTIPRYAFNGCLGLKEYTIQPHITTISAYAFKGCTSLVKLIIPETVTSIGTEFVPLTSTDLMVYFEGSDDAFSKMYSKPRTAKFTVVCDYNVQTETFGGSCGTGVNWTFNPATGVLTISGSGNFGSFNNASQVPWYNYFSQITEVRVHEGVKQLGSYLFNGCSNLKTVYLPSTVKTLGTRIFYDCTSLAQIKYVGTQSSWDLISKSGNWNYDMGKSVSGGTVIVPNSTENYLIDCYKNSNGDVVVSPVSLNTSYEGKMAVAFYKDNKLVDTEVYTADSSARIYELSFDCDTVKTIWLKGFDSVMPLCLSKSLKN